MNWGARPFIYLLERPRQVLFSSVDTTSHLVFCFYHRRNSDANNYNNINMEYTEQEMEYQPQPKQWNKMESTNSEDGDYEVEVHDAEYGEEVNYPYDREKQDPQRNEEDMEDLSREDSDVSDADKYADRNSDPGVHVMEQNYSLPYDMARGGGGNNMHGMNTNLYPGMNQGGNVPMPSGAESVSLGTATQTHEVRMPMLTSTFVS